MPHHYKMLLGAQGHEINGNELHNLRDYLLSLFFSKKNVTCFFQYWKIIAYFRYKRVTCTQTLHWKC
jgi:hypothetical protein